MSHIVKRLSWLFWQVWSLENAPAAWKESSHRLLVHDYYEAGARDFLKEMLKRFFQESKKQEKLQDR